MSADSFFQFPDSSETDPPCEVRRHAETALVESEARFRSFVEVTSDTIYKMSADWSVMRNLQGYDFLADTADPSHTWLERYIPVEAQPTVRAAIAEAIRTKTAFKLEHPVIRQDSTVGWTYSHAAPLLDARGEIVEWFGAAQDVTARRQAEEDRRAKEEAERIKQEKDHFISRVSHELRTPLNAILGFSQMLQLSLSKEKDIQGIGHIVDAGRHLLALVDDVLDLSRTDSGELALHADQVDAREAIRLCVQLVAHLAEAGGVVCEVQEATTPVWLWCDEQRLRQILLNLLSNAIKYNRKEGRVVVGCEPATGAGWRLLVKDTGYGIPVEELGRVFLPFERLAQPGDAQVQGTGLGLTLSRRLAERMGGGLGVESTVGEGSVFWLELPSKRPHQQTAIA